MALSASRVSPVTLDLTKPTTEAARPPGVSQHSAPSAVNFTTDACGSSGPSGNQASASADHSSRTLSCAGTTCALPLSESHVSFDAKTTAACWSPRRLRAGPDSSESRNHRSPSSSVSWMRTGWASMSPDSSWGAAGLAVHP